MGTADTADFCLLIATVLALAIQERGAEAMRPALANIRRRLKRRGKPALIELWDAVELGALQLADVLSEPEGAKC